MLNTQTARFRQLHKQLHITQNNQHLNSFSRVPCPHVACHSRVGRLPGAAAWFASSHHLVAVKTSHPPKVSCNLVKTGKNLIIEKHTINFLKMSPPGTLWSALGRHGLITTSISVLSGNKVFISSKLFVSL